MYREEADIQQKIEDFYLPFGGQLREDNRWVILSKKIPWNKIESDYAKQFSSSNMGAPAKPFWMALGSLIIKEKFQLSDEETVEHIKETPYLQYFIGMQGYKEKAPFDPSMAGHNALHCCSPMHPGWSTFENGLMARSLKRPMRFFSGSTRKKN